MGRFLILSLLIGSTVVARGQTPAERTYFATKDSIVRLFAADMRQSPAVPDGEKNNALAVERLAALLRPIVGSFTVAGFTQPGRANVDDLYPELGFGKLDGFRYYNRDSSSIALVSTRTLIARWASDTANYYHGPRTLAAQLREPDFYASAFNDDVAVSFFAHIPVRDAAALGVGEAMLVRWTQDDAGPITASEVIVAVVRGEHVFIIRAPAAFEMKAPPSCAADQSAAWKRRVNEDTVTALYHRCYRDVLIRQPEYRRIVEQVRSIVMSLPAR